MKTDAIPGKGGSNAAFLFFFAALLVAVVDTGKLYPVRLGVLRLAVFGFAAYSFWEMRRRHSEADGYAIAVFAFALLALGHAFSSVYFWVSMQHALNIALAAFLLLWVYRFVRQDPDAGWKGVFSAVCAIAALQAAVAVCQILFTEDARPRGTFDNTNFFGEYMAVATILCLARCVGMRGSARSRALYAAGAASFAAFALFLSASRAVLIAAVPAMAVLFLSLLGWRRGGKYLLAGGFPVLAVLGFRAAERFSSPDAYNYARLVLWKSAMKIFLANPFGIGLGGFKFLWYSAQEPVDGAFMRYGKYATTAHNEFLEVLAGLGFIGFLLFALVLLAPLFLAWRRFQGVEERRRWAAAGATGALVLSGAHAMVDFNFHEIGLVVLDAILLGSLLAMLPEGSPSKFRVALPPWTAKAGVSIAALLFVVSGASLGGKIAYALGERRIHAGDGTGAERLFRAAMVADPFCDAYPDAMGALYLRMHEAEKRSSSGRNERGEHLLAESIRWEGEALSLSPMDFGKIKRLASLFEQKYAYAGKRPDLEAAVRAAGRSIEINPYSADMLWKRSDLLRLSGREEEAAEDLRRAVAVEPNFCRGYAELASASTSMEAASNWREQEKACRERARKISVYPHEAWMLEDPAR